MGSKEILFRMSRDLQGRSGGLMRKHSYFDFEIRGEAF
ncbi:hypothetical protein TDIS_1493 [Thermosulfurimonas dismutans]|uniref:Uncharacterized protein n=1 Tax=Thermosulfurimonas dismutans TaxID=999894 RepID=A0A179D403_9BACT|nr:hypothetical protein TDIS_1493 [Thermosulfurimonas dismutans]